jgi:hypothetical protein
MVASERSANCLQGADHVDTTYIPRHLISAHRCLK